MPDLLTDRQQQILDFIGESINARGFPPTLREIGEHFGIRSTNGVNDHLKALEKKYGYKLADGQDAMKNHIWRLSHMGYTDCFEVLGALAALELVLAESGFKLEVGAGVAAFQKAYAAAK